MPTPIADAVLIGITALGLNPSDKVSLNASIYQLNSTVTISRAFQAPASGAIPINVLMQVTSDPAGSDVRMQREIISGEGPHGFKDLRNRYAGTNVNTAPGSVTQWAYTDHNYISATGGGTLNVGRVHYGHFVSTNGSHINEARAYDAGDVAINGGTIGTSIGLRVSGIGHPTNVAQAIGVRVVDSSASQVVIGVDLGTTAGRGKYAIRSTGDAPSVHAGKTRIGSTILPQYAMDITGDAQVTGAYRFANGLTITSGPGMPSFPAAKGSLYLSTDFGMYVNADGGMGWVRK